eukprot:CAMPEP_0173392412 /NCGR_PEP_ID=MMETSP1356-20130122/19492_1 /TAXON_ID=77927 ORGANISM="Hemiselmis virescens, Strain PCC157" /NCGR_SAMPLE_ID=MMETSP1356 /ASSEMBLY_ACC=CAM_ASM_000847 /LENGTH=84 /DNA_ID=CAMNT_0014350199 /DNA_START=346 /DNA_END=597 /DNA_ORIENTATION=+
MMGLHLPEKSLTTWPCTVTVLPDAVAGPVTTAHTFRPITFCPPWRNTILRISEGVSSSVLARTKQAEQRAQRGKETWRARVGGA